MKMRMIMFIF